MKIRLLLILTFVLNVCVTWSQTSFMAGDRIATFYPNGFDSSRTLPSLIFKKDLRNKGVLSATWSVKPVFSVENGKSIARILYSVMWTYMEMAKLKVL